jgi:hypothetical protein
MSCSYQGRVSNVEVLTDNKDNPWQLLSSWQKTLWQHHKLFQDAENCHTLALTALADGVDAATAQGAALLTWRAQVRDNWCDGRRRP